MDGHNQIPLMVVGGPTASGKSALAVALAKRLNGEVISADSMQVYADLHIGTARPTTEEMQGVPHHLLGFLPLSERYSVARYAEQAHRVIREVAARGHTPILCGGTGLYIQAVTENLTFFAEAGDGSLAVRTRLQEALQSDGETALWERLRSIDPETAAALHPHNSGRVVRALEVFELTGVPMSEWVRRSHAVPSPYKTATFVVHYSERQRLYDRIDRRVEEMMARGLLREAEQVLKTPYAPTAMQAIGYKELAPYLSGEGTLAEAVERIKQGTRRYAKRQLSWFRRVTPACWLDRVQIPGIEALADAAVARWQTI